MKITIELSDQQINSLERFLYDSTHNAARPSIYVSSSEISAISAIATVINAARRAKPSPDVSAQADSYNAGYAAGREVADRDTFYAGKSAAYGAMIDFLDGEIK